MDKPLRSLVSRLVLWFLAVSCLTVIVVGSLSYYRARSALVSDVYDRLEATIDLKEDALDKWIEEKIDAIMFIKTQPEVRDSATILLSGREGENLSDAYNVLFGVFQVMHVNMPDFYEISLLSPSGGEILVSSRLESQGDFRVSDTYFTRGLQRTYIQEIYLSPVFFKPTISIATPIHDDDGKRIGVLVGHLDLDYMDKIILERSGLGRTGESYLVNATNTFIAGRDFGRSEYPRGAHSPGIEKALKREDGKALYLNYEGVPVVGAFKWITKRQLALMAEISQEEAFQPARVLAFQILVIGLLISLLLAGIIYLVARRIASPILAVRDSAERITSGDRDTRAPVLGDDEVGDLARAFNTMVDEIQKSENRYRLLADNISDVIWVMDLSLKMTYVSPSTYRFRGYSPEEVLSQSVGEMMTPASFEKVKKILNEELALEAQAGSNPGRTRTMELEFLHKEGFVVWGEVAVGYLRDREGNALAILGVTRDINERKAAEKLLKRSEEKFQTVFRTSPGVIIITRAVDNIIVDINEEFTVLTGRNREDAIGKTALELGVWKDLEDREKIMSVLQSRGKVENLESQFLGQGGDYIKGLISANLVSLEGEPHFIFTVKDITQLKKTESDLRESEERYRILFNAGSDAVFVHGLDDSGTQSSFIMVNDVACEMLGLTRSELMELSLGDIFRSRDSMGTRGIIRKILGVKRGIFESVILNSSGREIPVEISAHNFDLHEKPAVIIIARDIAERKRLEEERSKIQARLIQANKMTSLGLMVSSLAHEINNPNNTIMFNLRRFATTWQDIQPILMEFYEEQGDFTIGGMPFSELSDIYPQLIAGTLESSEMIKAIVENLKGFVRQSTDTLDFNVDVNDVVRSAVSLLQSQVRKGVGRLEIDLAENLPRVKGNPQKLIQVMVNLFSNALEALTGDDQGVRVYSSFDRTDSLLKLTIEDEGNGMTEEQIRNATEPFYSTKHDSGGTGLGLTITKMLLDEHGADLSIESTPGQGTTVTVAIKAEKT